MKVGLCRSEDVDGVHSGRGPRLPGDRTKGQREAHDDPKEEHRGAEINPVGELTEPPVQTIPRHRDGDGVRNERFDPPSKGSVLEIPYDPYDFPHPGPLDTYARP